MMVLVTGGSASGKSAYAEQVAMTLPGERYYLAAMKPFGEEGARRIERHRELRRGKGFVTIECFDGLERSVIGHDTGGCALVECLGNVVANELFLDDGSCVSYDDAVRRTLEGLDAVCAAFDHVVFVGNEVGSDGVSYFEETRRYIDVLGAVSCNLAQRCDAVVECVCEQPMVVKGAAALGDLATKEGAAQGAIALGDLATQGAVAQDALANGAVACDVVAQGDAAQGVLAQEAMARDAVPQKVSAKGVLAQEVLP